MGENGKGDTTPLVSKDLKLELEKQIGLKDDKGRTKRWNTQNLSKRLGVDVACAATAAGLVAPLITIVDKFVHPQ